MFDGFSQHRVQCDDGIGVHALVAGSGPPLLLLHGCPQTSVMWREVAPQLTDRFTVVVPDLRGYGNTSKPAGAADHSTYSFRAMAGDQVQVMASLGFDSFRVAGHDRGARVAHRMALDHPQRVSRLALLDILPTLTLYDRTDRVFATAYWEWFFFTQAPGFPEALLGAAPEAFLRHELGALLESGHISGDAWTAYLAAISAPGAVHGMCEDYRAGATIDLDHDRADLDRQVECPLLVMWGAENVVWERFDMIGEWSERARTVTGVSVPSGHYLAEEAPEVTAGTLAEFFS